MNEIRILGEGGEVRISVSRYERSTAENGSDANWLVCDVAIDVPPFHGKFDASFTVSDFAHFGDGLALISNQLEGEAMFSPDEGALFLSVKMKSRGHLAIEGNATIVGAGRAVLNFAFSSDQSYLGELQNSIKELLTAFPVRSSS